MGVESKLHTGPTPLWQQVVALIRRHIDEGVWLVDYQIPSERELCDRYGISRTTVRLAIADAVNSGLLRRIHGKGTFVAPPKISQPLFQITSFEDTMRTRGMVPGTRLLQAQRQTADAATAQSLGLNAGDPVVSLRVLGLGSGEHMVLYHSIVPQQFGDSVWELLERRHDTHHDLMVNQLLAELHGWSQLRCEQTYEAALAGPEESQLLHVPRNAPLFVVSSLFANPAGQVVEFRRAVYRADKYQFHVTRQMEMKRGGSRA